MKKKFTLFVFVLLSTSALLLTNIAEAQSYLWAKGAGGIGYDYNFSTTTDAVGNIIVTGYFASDSITFGTTTLINADPTSFSNDFFLVKYDPNGNVLWAKSAGGLGNDRGVSVITDANGNIIVSGSFNSPTITFGPNTLTSSGNYDIFIVKYNSSGNVIWAKSESGTGNSEGFSVVTDASENIIVVGYFYGSTLNLGTTILTNAGSVITSDVFIVKYDSSGNMLWAKSAGGTNEDSGYSITTDIGGNTYITGYFMSSSITFGTTNLSNANTGLINTQDIFIAKYDNNGNVVWAKSAGGTDTDRGASIITDYVGNVIVTGTFSSSTITFGTTTLINAGPSGYQDIFVVKYDNSGNVLWAKRDGGTGYEGGSSLTTDSGGNIIVTGYFYSNSLTFGTTTLTNSTTIGSSDVFIVMYNSNGNAIWANSAGGAFDDTGFSITTDAVGNIILTGYFLSPTITFGNTTLTNAGLVDFFIIKISGLTDLAENEFGKEVNIYPNPNTGKFQLSTAGISGIKYIEVYSLPGEKVFSQALHSQQQTLDLQIVAGIYFVKVSDGENTFTQKLIVQ